MFGKPKVTFCVGERWTICDSNGRAAPRSSPPCPTITSSHRQVSDCLSSRYQLTQHLRHYYRSMPTTENSMRTLHHHERRKTALTIPSSTVVIDLKRAILRLTMRSCSSTQISISCSVTALGPESQRWRRTTANHTVDLSTLGSAISKTLTPYLISSSERYSHSDGRDGFMGTNSVHSCGGRHMRNHSKDDPFINHNLRRQW